MKNLDPIYSEFFSDKKSVSNQKCADFFMSVGERFQNGDINYSVISNTAVQVGFGLTYEPYTSAVAKDYDKNISIPSFILYSGKSFKVKRLGAHAFYFCYKIKKVIVPSTVTSFEWSCFNGMSALEELIIPGDNKITYLGIDFIANSPLHEFFIPSSIRSMDYDSLRSTNTVKFSYCGKRRFDNFTNENTVSVIYVSRDYPYEKFGNINVEKTLYCETKHCITMRIKAQRKIEINILVFTCLSS